MFTTDLVNLYNRNIFKTFLYIYIIQDEKLCAVYLYLWLLQRFDSCKPYFKWQRYPEKVLSDQVKEPRPVTNSAITLFKSNLLKSEENMLSLEFDNNNQSILLYFIQMTPILVLLFFQNVGISKKHFLVETQQVTWIIEFWIILL